MNDQTAGAFQGAAGGAGAGAGFGPWGAAIGAGVGGLAGLVDAKRKANENARRERLDNAYAAIQTAYSPFVKGTAGKASTADIGPGSFGGLVSGATSGLNAYSSLNNAGVQNQLNAEKLRQLQNQGVGLGGSGLAGQPYSMNGMTA